jgi:hypothetical protein
MALNDQIIAYLKQNNIAVSAGDFHTGQPADEDDQILYWNAMKLGPQPTKDQLDTAWSNKISLDNSIAYKSNRSYPAIGDQLDMLWHAIDSGSSLDKNSDFYKSLANVKSQFPK